MTNLIKELRETREELSQTVSSNGMQRLIRVVTIQGILIERLLERICATSTMSMAEVKRLTEIESTPKVDQLFFSMPYCTRDASGNVSKVHDIPEGGYVVLSTFSESLWLPTEAAAREFYFASRPSYFSPIKKSSDSSIGTVMMEAHDDEHRIQLIKR